MKKFYLLTLALIFALSLQAQVSVTYMVDVTNYVDAGNAVTPEGIRVGGNFAAFAATSGGNAMMDWTPSDANSAMTDMGDNIWSITVEYPEDQIGSEQLYKFVNGDWGNNEGTADESTIADDGCGVDDGAGNINRTFIIPSENAVQTYCWDACLNCDGTSDVDDLETVSDLEIAPNPSADITRFSFSLEQNENITISVYNLLGAKVADIYNGSLAAGAHIKEADLTALSSGLYVYRIQAGNEEVTAGRLVKQ